MFQIMSLIILNGMSETAYQLDMMNVNARISLEILIIILNKEEL